MKKNKISPIYYFKYFYREIGIHMYIYMFINFLVGLFDGLGLAMFIPLLLIATGNTVENESLQKFETLLNLVERIGLEFNLTVALSLMIFIFLLKGLFYYLRIIYLVKIRLYVMRKIRINLVNSLSKITYEGFTLLDAGRIQNNMVGETGKSVNAMNAYFNSMQHIIMLSTYLFLAILSNWKFAVMVGIGGVMTNFIYKYINRVTKEYSRKQSNLGHDFNGNLIQAIQNFKYLKATGLNLKYDKKLLNNIFKSEQFSFKIGKVSALGESIREPLIIIIIATVIVIQVNIMNGDFTLILVSLLLFYRALAHLVSMQNSWNSFIGSSAGIDSVNKLFEEFNRNKEINGIDEIDNFNTIDVKDLNLSFGNTQILKNINLNIKSNTSIAFVGESGAGKTSLANVICGLQKPTSGKIILNDNSLYNSNLNFFRKQIGYITQEPVIFNDSIFNNITFWDEKTPENLEKFYKTISLVSLDVFVNDLENKEDTKLGNNGILISGGQKQRITIARELYKDVKILIMDEATSALDSETEQYIKENIDNLKGKYTIIIIAHRLSTIKNVDKIFLLDKGEVKYEGDFESLLRYSVKFKNLVELQNL